MHEFYIQIITKYKYMAWDSTAAMYIQDLDQVLKIS